MGRAPGFSGVSIDQCSMRELDGKSGTKRGRRIRCLRGVAVRVGQFACSQARA